MRAVNLLPKDAARVRKPVNRVALAGVAGGAAVSMVLAALYLSAHSTVGDREAELAAARAELAATPKPSVRPSANRELAKERQGRVAALTKALGTRIGWDRLLREISSVLPGDVWLTELQAHGPSAASAVSGGTSSSSSPFTIQGYTYTQEGVARFLARMQLVPDLTAVELESSSLTQLNLQDVYQFTIKAQVRPTGATA
jgi:Tfp pilus assembly protein PilN